MGDAAPRSELWMPALHAVIKYAWLKAFYDRLVAGGKPKKLAVIAATRKLLSAMVRVARSGKPFVPKLWNAA